MEESWLVVNSVPTKILTWGKKIQDNFTKNDQLIVVIPGNPGVTKFYVDFLQELHDVTNVPIWVLSHAGHEINLSEGVPSKEGNQDLYSLEGQIRHKEKFIEEYVLPKGVNFYLIGHSIGSYITLELLKNPSIKNRVLHNYLLFPTIEYMAETSNGVFIMKYLKPLKFLLPLVYVLYILPNFIKIFLVSIYIKLTSIPERFCDVVLEFFHPHTIDNFCAMGMEELYNVRGRNDKVIKENLDKIKLYYGQTDGWVPITYYQKLKDDIPKVDAELCDKGYKHAFVLYDSIPMAHLVAEWMKRNK